LDLRGFLIATLAAALSGAPSFACDLVYPADYIAPTIEERISGAQIAFVGTVMGLRRHNGEIVTSAPDCYAEDAAENCWDYQSTIVTGVLVVDEPIHGIRRGAPFEMRRGEGGGACDYELTIGEQYLILDHDADHLGTAPSPERLAVWRAIEPVS
jgi:hypothetical protein